MLLMGPMSVSQYTDVSGDFQTGQKGETLSQPCNGVYSKCTKCCKKHRSTTRLRHLNVDISFGVPSKPRKGDVLLTLVSLPLFSLSLPPRLLPPSHCLVATRGPLTCVNGTRCADGEACLLDGEKCDGFMDCSDHSDEDNCTSESSVARLLSHLKGD